MVNGYRPVLLYAGLTNYPSLACCLATLLRLLSLFTSDTKWLRHPAEHRHAAKRRYHNVRAAGRERHTPTSDLHWLISTTASVKGDTAPVQVVPADTPSVSCSDDGSISLPPARQHLASGGTTTRTKDAKVQISAIRSTRKVAALIPLASDCLVLRWTAWTSHASER